MAAAGAPPGPVAIAQAQGRGGRTPEQTQPVKGRQLSERELSGRFPGKPSRAPAFKIPVAPLGFGAPGPIYLGERYSQVSLDFMGENRLLFTFHIPALLRRDGQDGDERRIRAVLLALPSGTVEAEASWTVHDYARYLWMLQNGRFLLRNRDELFAGGPSLELKPFLIFPGPLLRVELDPTQQFMVTLSREPLAEASKAGAATASSTASDSASTAGPGPAAPQYVLRILRRSTGQVMVVNRLRVTIHLPINSSGYVENLRGKASEWVLNFNDFSGGSRILGDIESTCMPDDEFVSTRELLVTACSAVGGDRLTAMTTDGRDLWAYLTPGTQVWPQLVMAPDGLRIARETLVTDYAVGPTAPLGPGNLRGQLVRVFDAATGDVVLETPASPVFDGGGNVAISPSGRRVAVLNGGAIQVFDLPAPPPLPPPLRQPPRAADGQPAH